MTDLNPKDIDPLTNQPPPTPGLLLSHITTQPIQWLWHNRIPLGKITFLVGDSGMGKSLIALDLAARISTGTPMPDHTPCQQANIILIAPQDSPADILKPRLEAAHGDPSHITLLNTITDRPFSLFHDLDLLVQTIQRTNASLIIIDPFTAITTFAREHNIQAAFTSLAKIAERTLCTILILRHLNRGNTESSSTSAPINLLVVPHPYAEGKRILATAKNTLSQRANNLSYIILTNESGIPHIQWLEENTYPLSTLLENSSNLSIIHQQILQILINATEPLGAQEITERTGQNYSTVRGTLIRMCTDREIMRVSRGRYKAFSRPVSPQTNLYIKTTATTETTETIDPNNPPPQ